MSGEGTAGADSRPRSVFDVPGVYPERTATVIDPVWPRRRDRAIEMLETVLREPGWYTPARHTIEPTWKPLRGDPRFERLIGKS